LVLDKIEIVVLIDVMPMMVVVKIRVELVIEDSVMVVVGQDVPDYEHIVLVHLLRVENLNYYNPLVVFFDNNLFK
jgi:hypothetical protein